MRPEDSANFKPGCEKGSPFYGAYRKGFLAGLSGDDRCPYPDVRTWRGAVTWSRAYRRAWYDGHRDGGEDCESIQEGDIP